MSVWKKDWIVMASINCQIKIGGRWERGEYGKREERGNLLKCKINK